MVKSSLSAIFSLIIFPFLFSNTASAQNQYIKLCLQAVDYEKTGKLDEAVNKYTEAINLKPAEWSGYSYRAKVFLQSKKYDEALNDISKAITLSPQTLSLYSVRGNCYTAKGIYDKAIEDYTMTLSKVNKSDKELYLTYFQRGRAYYYNKQYKEAITDFSQAISLAKEVQQTMPVINSWRAHAFLDLKNFPEAIKDFDVYLSANPNDFIDIFYQGYSFLKNGETEKAKSNTLKLTGLDPTNEVYFSGDHMLDIYDLEMRRTKSKKLIDDANTLITEQKSIPSKTLAYIKLTDAFNKLDSAWLYSPGLNKEDLNLKDAILEGIFIVYPQMKIKPEISEFARKYTVQAASFAKEKKYDEAINLWSKVLKISPYFSLAYYNRSLLFELKGDYRNSIADMEKYLKLMAGAPDARAAQDKIYEWEGKIKDLPVTQETYNKGAINEISSDKYSPGNFHVAFAFGGSFGIQIVRNPSLAELWTQSTPSLDYKYTDKLPFLYSGDIEIAGKPLKRIGIGVFGKLGGGIGARTKVSGTKYNLDMSSLQYGGLARFYFLINDLGKTPDLYLQYAYGKSTLTGSYSVSTMDGIIFDYSYMKHFKGSAPYNSIGLGMGGKISKNGYLTLSLDYFSSKFEKITYEITTNTTVPSEVGQKGSLPNTTADYNGIVMKFMVGFCF